MLRRQLSFASDGTRMGMDHVPVGSGGRSAGVGIGVAPTSAVSVTNDVLLERLAQSHVARYVKGSLLNSLHAVLFFVFPGDNSAYSGP